MWALQRPVQEQGGEDALALAQEESGVVEPSRTAKGPPQQASLLPRASLLRPNFSLAHYLVSPGWTPALWGPPSRDLPH